MHISKAVLEQYTTFPRTNPSHDNYFTFNTHHSTYFQDPSHLKPIMDFDYNPAIYNTGPTLPAMISQYISPNKPIQDSDLHTFSLMCKSMLGSPKINDPKTNMNIQSEKYEKQSQMEISPRNKEIFTISKKPQRKGKSLSYY